MRIIKLSLLCLAVSFSAKAQDTLFFKSKQKQVVIVKEVSPAEIQYKKLELPDGPMYIVSKNDVEKIIYKNGYADVFKPTIEETKPSESFAVYNNQESLNHEKITYNDAKGRYYRLVSLSDRHPDVNRRPNLMLKAKNLRTLKMHQDGTRTCAIIFGGFTIAGLGLYGLATAASYGGYVDPIYGIPPMVCGALAVAFGATSIAVNLKLREKRKEFVNLYNE
ncbi:MAG: hypothetical protein V4565_02000 [Bacteroidota bacterium]